MPRSFSSRAVLAVAAMAGILISCDNSNSANEDPTQPADTSSRTQEGTTAVPVFSPSGGTYATAPTVRLSSATSGADIYFTTDGSTPTTSSDRYSEPLEVVATQTVKAIAVKSGMTTSTVVSATYILTTGGSTTGTVAWGGQSYKTVKIGTQTWMAENLNYAGTSGAVGVCYGNSADSCKKYGRLYTWTEAMNGAAGDTGSPTGVQGICPTGWHVPSDAEWTTLTTYVGASTSGLKLRSRTGWLEGNGTDDFGFTLLPAGYGDGKGAFIYAGRTTDFWTASEYDAKQVWYRSVYYADKEVSRSGIIRTDAIISLRCVRN